MATSRDAPNPLRPYYIPPSIGLPPDVSQNQTASSTTPALRSGSSKPSFGTQARDILSDLDYDAYFPNDSPTVAGHAKKLLDHALWNYTSVLLAQPFEVAKTILQVHEASSQVPGLALEGKEWGHKSRPESFASGKFVDFPSDEESDEDSPSYFTSTAPNSRLNEAPPSPYSPAPSRSRSPQKRRRHVHSRSRSSTPTRPPPSAVKKLDLKRSDALLEVIAQLWQKESAWGVWKATNSTFIYNFLLKTTEGWFRSLISAVLNVPDSSLLGSANGIGGLDIIDSPSPLTSLGVAVAATAIAATLLAPLDLIRTRLIVSPISSQPRSIYPCLALLPSLTISPSIFPATLLHACIPTLISTSTPLFLRSMLSIDPILTPTTYSMGTFASSIGELFVRLPLETVLRRGQVAVLQDHENQRVAESYNSLPSMSHGRQKVPSYTQEEDTSFSTIVQPGTYRGVLGTMWYIARDEGVTVIGPNAAKVASAKALGIARPIKSRKGQGVHGLWRGWRVGVWGLVGVWGAAALGGGGGEF
ncbi:mitochondrial carrier [Plenodomus tracheiphilus IPT5]|uniref:Mitochondrial carrier n=1 Tax=Plenodomus tracheiphilus IPT5 TaxID=1408161 RepID=A0A6A7ARA9_9PLEO|nr:mitochondrial carrier [Plenodomus tracheiphilus IPT5]